MTTASPRSMNIPPKQRGGREAAGGCPEGHRPSGTSPAAANSLAIEVGPGERARRGILLFPPGYNASVKMYSCWPSRTMRARLSLRLLFAFYKLKASSARINSHEGDRAVVVFAGSH